MLTIRNTEVFGLERAIISSGNAFSVGEIDTRYDGNINDDRYKTVKKLGSAKIGSGHDHFLLGIHVQFDILYPQYWTIEAERYHNFEIITSQSKMHRLVFAAKDAAGFPKLFNKYVDEDLILKIYLYCNYYEKTEEPEEKYKWFMKALSNLPMGYEMWMTCDLTYLQIKTIYFQRKTHKLKEDWGAFCEWCEQLPRFKELVGIE